MQFYVVEGKFYYWRVFCILMGIVNEISSKSLRLTYRGCHASASATEWIFNDKTTGGDSSYVDLDVFVLEFGIKLIVADFWWFRTGFWWIMCRYSTVSKSRTVIMSIILKGFENEGFVIWVFWFWMRIQGNHVIAVQNIADKIKKEREEAKCIYFKIVLSKTTSLFYLPMRGHFS